MGNFNAESAGHNNRPIQHVHEVNAAMILTITVLPLFQARQFHLWTAMFTISRSVLIPMTDIIMNFAVLPLPLSRLETADMCILQKHIPHMQTDMHMNSDWLH